MHEEASHDMHISFTITFLRRQRHIKK